mgnify:CR=1 FL=1
MKYDEIILRLKNLYERNPLAKDIVKVINKLSIALKSRYEAIKIMGFCGTHEWTITHYGLRSLMPTVIDLIPGPGCPVCITPALYVDQLVKISLEKIHVLTYGDAYKLRGSANASVKSLEEAKSIGGKVTIVYSFLDAIKIAKSNPYEKFIFFGIGFETTMPSIASHIMAKTIPPNLTILPAYRLTPPIVKYLVENVPDIDIHGIIAPGHVSSIIGSDAWNFIPKNYKIPTVVAGFEPLDVLLAILEILKQLTESKSYLVNEYVRVVKPQGNIQAKKAITEVYEIVDAIWRGIGRVPMSGAIFKEKYKEFDACYVYGLKHPITEGSSEMPGCICREIVLGKAKPDQCPLFMKICKPQTPYGPCMVSIEGTCRIWAEHGGIFRIDLGTSLE